MQNANSVFRLDGKVALVVGGGSGIGHAAALALASSGASVACGDVNHGNAAKTAAETGGKGYALDICDKQSVQSCVSGVLTDFGKLDILIVTPAVNVRKRLLSYSDEELDKVVDLNLKGNFRITRAAAEVMSPGGAIVLTSSIRSLVVEPGQGVYAATKASLVQLARGFAVELAPKGIRVNVLAPGVVETPLTQPIKNNEAWYGAYADRNALKRWAQPEEMAWPLVFLSSAASSYVTGTVLFVDGGWTGIDGRFDPPL